MQDVKRKDEQEYVVVQMEKKAYGEMKATMESSVKVLDTLEVYYKMLWVITSAINHGSKVHAEGSLLFIDGQDVYAVIAGFEAAGVFEEGEYGH